MKNKNRKQTSRDKRRGINRRTNFNTATDTPFANLRDIMAERGFDPDQDVQAKRQHDAKGPKTVDASKYASKGRSMKRKTEIANSMSEEEVLPNVNVTHKQSFRGTVHDRFSKLVDSFFDAVPYLRLTGNIEDDDDLKTGWLPSKDCITLTAINTNGRAVELKIGMECMSAKAIQTLNHTQQRFDADVRYPTVSPAPLGLVKGVALKTQTTENDTSNKGVVLQYGGPSAMTMQFTGVADRNYNLGDALTAFKNVNVFNDRQRGFKGDEGTNEFKNCTTSFKERGCIKLEDGSFLAMVRYVAFFNWRGAYRRPGSSAQNAIMDIVITNCMTDYLRNEECESVSSSRAGDTMMIAPSYYLFDVIPRLMLGHENSNFKVVGRGAEDLNNFFSDADEIFKKAIMDPLTFGRQQEGQVAVRFLKR